MEIKVLGTGCCSKCATLTKNAEEAVRFLKWKTDREGMR